MDKSKDTNPIAKPCYLPEFRVQGLEYSTAGSQGDTSPNRTTPWENHQSTAKEHPTAISELEKDGIVLEALSSSTDPNEAASSSEPANKFKQFKGLVRMTRDQYDHVLKIRPGAALKYVDEDDGELINVGSSFELEQRLQEPIDGEDPVNASDFTKCIPVSEKPRHSFTISDSWTVKSIWRGWENDTHIRRWGSSQGADKATPMPTLKVEKPTPPNYHYFPPSTAEELANGFQTFKARKLDSKAGFSSPPPLISEVKEHENRWASYSSLPGSLDKQPVSLKNATEAPDESSSDKLVDTSEVKPSKDIEVLSKTGFTCNAPDDTAPPATASGDSSGEGPANAESSASPPSGQDLLAGSVLSLIEQFGNLAAEAFKPGPELSEQLSLAKKEIPQNLEMALRASANAIDQVRNVVYAVNQQEAASCASTAGSATSGQADDESNQARQTLVPPFFTVSNPKPASEGVTPPAGFNWIYQAEKIIGSREIAYGKHPALAFKQYLVRWVGRPDTDDVWYDEENLGDCGALISDYEARNRDSYGNMFHKVAQASEMHARTSGDKMITHPRSFSSYEHSKRGPARSSQSTPNTVVDQPKITKFHDQAIVPPSVGPLIDIETSTRESKERAASIGVRNRKDVMSMPDPNRYKPKEFQVPTASLDKTPAMAERPTAASSTQNRSKEIKDLPQSGNLGDLAVKNHNSWNGLPSLIDALPEPWQVAGTKQEDRNVTRPLKHRKSWHPGSYNSDKTFSFSAADVMARYPSLSQLEGSSTSKRGEASRGSTVSMSAPENEHKLRASKSVEFRPPPPPPASSEIKPTRSITDAWAPPAPHPITATPTAPSSSIPALSNPLRRAASVRERRVRWPDTVEELVGDQPNRLNRAATSASSAFRSRDASRRDRKLKDVERRLVEMGFSKTEAEAASAGADGNLELAIDLLEEDQAAWKGRRSGRNLFDATSAYTDQMPGAWESWRNAPF